MLVFAGFVANSPLLLPSINKDRLADVEKTREAFALLSEELYGTHPDTIILFAEGATVYPDAFSVNVADPFTTDLSEFGDLSSSARRYHPNFPFVDRLQRAARKAELPVSLTTDPALNFSTAVPLELLTDHLPDIRIVPITPAHLTPKLHFEFGTLIKELAQESEHRVAILACGDLSHALSDDAPGGKTPEGAEFDERIQKILGQRNTAGLLQIDPTLIDGAHDAAYRQLCMLFGALEGLNVTSHMLSYQAPFGVGYAVAHYHLH